MQPFDLTQVSEDAIRFRVRVSPAAKKASLGGIHDGSLKISVTAAPENGKANQAVIAAIAKRLGISKSRVTICSGPTARVKTLEISGVSLSEVQKCFDTQGE